ncbi:hypothetical protein EJB05_18441, partial [Eragrostis curvula]
MSRAKPQANNDGFRSRTSPRSCIYTHLRDTEKIIGVLQCSGVKTAEKSVRCDRNQEMEVQARCLCVVAMLLVAGLAALETAHGAGECGREPADRVALKLAPCAAATQNPRAPVAATCCAQVRSIGRNPKCLCAVMLSATARNAGVKPAVAMTIPKRCAIANRPIGYKCGPYTLP